MSTVPPHTAIQICLYVVLAVRLVASHLLRAYPFFFSYIVFEVLRTAVPYWIPNNTTAYAYLYFVTQPVAWILNALVVLEVFQSALRSHAGIASAGRRMVSVALIVASAVSLGSLFFGADTPQSPYETLERYILLERVIYSSLLVFLLILLTFLSYYPVPMTRNALLHAGILGFYFVARVALWIIRNLAGPSFTQTMNLAMAGVVIVVLAGWILSLTRAGEQKRVRSSRRANKEEEERLIAQLERFNDTLLRSGRK